MSDGKRRSMQNFRLHQSDPTGRRHLSYAEKARLDLASVREQPMACRTCGVQVMPADMPAHIRERCQGRPAPGPRDRWIDHRQAIELGVPKVTLSRWANNGRVRFMGGRGDKKYLYRDLLDELQKKRPYRRR